jgi:hypothetical protein
MKDTNFRQRVIVANRTLLYMNQIHPSQLERASTVDNKKLPYDFDQTDRFGLGSDPS